MRITNSMLIKGYIGDLNRNMLLMAKTQKQISSGKKLTRASDDPIAASRAMEVRRNLSKVQQYSNNVIEAKELLGQTESSLNELNSLFARAYELAVTASNGANGEDERDAIKMEIEQIKEQLVVSSNTIFGTKYIFGGTNTTQKPFEVRDVSGEQVLFYNEMNLNDLDDPANADVLDTLRSERVNYEIGFGTFLDITYNGIDVIGYGEDNAFNVLNNFVSALESGDSAAINESIGKIKERHHKIVTLQGETGAKNNRLDFFEKRLESDEFNYINMKESVESVDIDEAILQLKLQETVYEAALAAGSKIITPNLTDFLR